jgi:GT2 family glycosyltransferase
MAAAGPVGGHATIEPELPVPVESAQKPALPIAARSLNPCPMSAVAPRVVAVITTYRRPDSLRRLIASLAPAAAQGLSGLVVVDNAAEAAVAQVVQAFPWPAIYRPQAANLGHGGGHAAGLTVALKDQNATHFWLLDDDAVVRPETLAELLVGLAATGAAAAVPLLINAAGWIAWYPGLLDRAKWHVIQRPSLTPEEFRRRCGDEPVPFSWTPWGMLLLTRRVVEAIGLPRLDFGFSSIDIEYALRLTANHSAVLVPRAVGQHLPPATRKGTEAYFIQCMDLQNLSFLTLRLRHGRRALRHLPGHFWRFFHRWGWSRRNAGVAWRAIWRGAVAGRPAGVVGGDEFHRAWDEARAR